MTSKRQTPWFVLNSPELGSPFQDFYEQCRSNGILDEKTKELLMLVIASVFRSKSSTQEHINAAFKTGATREEITEALLIAAAEAARSQLSWAENAYKKHLHNIKK
jgi:alkylhydroperoxidase/carboxymuconolactone decarboxylase family protein YurZ